MYYMAHKWESTIGRGITYKVVEVLEIVIFLSDGIAYIMLFCEGIYLILLRYFNGVELINSSVIYYFMYTFVLSVALFLQKSWRPKSCCYGSKRVSSKNSSVLIPQNATDIITLYQTYVQILNAPTIVLNIKVSRAGRQRKSARKLHKLFWLGLK